MKRIEDDQPRPRVIAHWHKVLDTPGLPAISYESARAALKNLRDGSIIPVSTNEREAP